MTEKITLRAVREVLNLPGCCGQIKGQDNSYCALGKKMILDISRSGYDLDPLTKMNNYTARNAKLATSCNDRLVQYAVPEGKAFGAENPQWTRHIKATAMIISASPGKFTRGAREFLKTLIYSTRTEIRELVPGPAKVKP